MARAYGQPARRISDHRPNTESLICLRWGTVFRAPVRPLGCVIFIEPTLSAREGLAGLR